MSKGKRGGSATKGSGGSSIRSTTRWQPHSVEKGEDGMSRVRLIPLVRGNKREYKELLEGGIGTGEMVKRKEWGKGSRERERRKAQAIKRAQAMVERDSEVSFRRLAISIEQGYQNFAQIGARRLWSRALDILGYREEREERGEGEGKGE